MYTIQTQTFETKLGLSYIYIWNLSEFKLHLSKTNQTTFIINMNLLCHPTWKGIKKGKASNKFQNFFIDEANFLSNILLSKKNEMLLKIGT